MTLTNTKTKKLRLLVAIASFGEKNLGFLKSVITTYRRMTFEVDVVVLSNAPKDLEPGVKVMVGLPIKNPWSLPFAHKPVFAENVEKYDLFIYSEDDMGVTEENIRAFLRVSPQLAADEIAGYLRYEADPTGQWSLPEVHGSFHWKPETVRKRGSLTVAEFSNDHAAFYLLNQAQLKQAIGSGGFLVAPYEGRHDMLCAAATDPYANCGFRKVICISELESFCIHHLPNRYIGEFGLPLPAVRAQIKTLIDISNHLHPISTLCEVESKLQRRKWSKDFYERPCEELLRAVPSKAKTVLSIGCGWGATEEKLQKRGAMVTALPLDSVIGAEAGRLGIEMVYETLEKGLSLLGQRKFDCVMITNLLHLLPDPDRVTQDCANLVQPAGTLVVMGPNFSSLRIVGKRALRREDYAKLSNPSESGIIPYGPKNLKPIAKGAGMKVIEIQWTKSDKKPAQNTAHGRINADTWILTAHQ